MLKILLGQCIRALLKIERYLCLVLSACGRNGIGKLMIEFESGLVPGLLEGDFQ